MTCLIVDDEPVARDILRTYIGDTPQLTLSGECENAVDALSFLRKTPVDLIFLDINMPKLSGISFLKSLPDPPNVVFTTAYSEYALDGFELDVIDYLLKPFSFERFLKAVNKVPEPVIGSQAHIVIKADGKTYRINEQDIIFAESMGDYASGTNHTLPTYGYARMYSGVSLHSFQKFITMQTVSEEGLKNLGPTVETLAEIEGLHAHKNAVSLRLEKVKIEI